MKKLYFTLLFLTLAVSASAIQSAMYAVEAYIFNATGNIQSASGKINFSSVGETVVGQGYSDQYSMQSGFFNDYYFDKPTPTVTPTNTVTPTMTVTGTPIRSFGGELLDKKFVYPAPHPIRGPYANIYFHLAESADVKIKIYTTSNKLVIAKDFGMQQAGKNYWQWHVANLANGVYLMLITAENGNKKTKVIKKLGIIK